MCSGKVYYDLQQHRELHGVRDVAVVRVEQLYPLHEEQLKAAKEPVTIDQPHCAFLPHCVVLFPSYRDPKNPKMNRQLLG